MIHNSRFNIRIPVFLVYSLMMLLFILPSVESRAQNDPDTLIVQVPIGSPAKDSIQHSPQRATLYAMVLPGLGQAYNKKYWKIPIVYAGFGVLGYFISMNHTEYMKYRQAYDYVTIGDPGIPVDNEYAQKYTAEKLLQARDYYRRNLEFTYILTGAWYILTVIDAVVDAHLFDYDVSDDLGFKIEPFIHQDFMHPMPAPSASISLTWRF